MIALYVEKIKPLIKLQLQQAEQVRNNPEEMNERKSIQFVAWLRHADVELYGGCEPMTLVCIKPKEPEGYIRQSTCGLFFFDENKAILPGKLQEVMQFDCYYSSIYPTLEEVLSQMPNDWREKKVSAIHVYHGLRMTKEYRCSLVQCYTQKEQN